MLIELLFKDETYKIIGICMEIHKTLGIGLKEISYTDAMEFEFLANQIPCEREKRFVVRYKEKVLRNPYVADFLVFENIILEIKSSASIIEAHHYQALSYLTVSGKKVALIINFGEKSLTWKRLIL